ncbi:MAG: PAS domain S-box protein, partial [Bryobacteraceae bacterium]|nr:PAS domain S-box protein [Bryobacteraceae bacterium]
MSCGRDIDYSDAQRVPEDTEEAKHVSRLAKTTHRMLRLAQNIAGVGVWEWNLLTNTTICSLFNRELYGLDPGSEMPVGDDFLALIHLEDRQELSRALGVACATGRYDAEFRVIWPDGRVHWLLGKGEASLDRTGHPIKITGINMDITERKRAEESVRLSESKFRSMFAGAATGMVIAGPDGTFIEVNAAFCGIVGYSREDLVSKSILSLTHPADRDHHAQLCHQLLSLDTPALVVEKRYLHKDGSEVWVRDSSALVRSPIDGSVQILVISEDITSRKNAEEQREQHARELADKNEQLAAALLAAEEATLMKSRFLANMSHEIRTPLNGVMGMADLVLGTNLDEEQREYAEAILRSGENLRQVINDILDISRIEAGKLKIESIPFEMLVAVEQVAQLVSISPRAKGVTITTEIDSALPRWLSGDPMRFRQVLTNLAGNAVKFTDTGEVTIHIAVLWDSKASLAA